VTKSEKITVVTEISSCPLLKLTCRLSAGNEISIKQFDEGRFGRLYRFDRPLDGSASDWFTAPFVIKLMHPGDDCRSIANLHAEIARKAGSFTAGWEELLRGMPFWMGKVKSGKDQTIALVSHDLDALGFVQLHRLLEQDLHKYFSLDFRERVKLAASFALSYAILEKLHFLHADINSENLFVNLQTAEALLIDFDAGVLRLRGNEIPKSPGKPNEFLPLELKSATGADVTKFNEAAELWSVGFMVSTLIFGIHPLFFLSHLSRSVISEYLARHKWPEINLHSKISYVLHNPVKQKQKAVRNYLHFVRHDLGDFERLRPKAFSLLQQFINEGALHPEKRPSASKWVRALADEDWYMTEPRIYKRNSKPMIFCSFCGKSQINVEMLIVGGTSAYICNECIDLCAEVKHKEKLKYMTP
jgi:hypothetical protein